MIDWDSADHEFAAENSLTGMRLLYRFMVSSGLPADEAAACLSILHAAGYRIVRARDKEEAELVEALP